MAQKFRGRTTVSGSFAAPLLVDTTDIAALAVTSAKLAVDAITGAQLADDAVDSEHYTDASIDTAHYAVGSVDRTALTENALDVIGINLGNVKTATGIVLIETETAGSFHVAIGTNQLYLQGEEAISETEVSVAWFEVYLPANYVAAGDVKLRAVVDVTGAGTLGACTIDFEARESDNDGAVGSDICATAATAVTATAAAHDFVVTATALVAGDKLVVKMTTSINESAGSAIRALVTKLQLLCDVK